ncbi:TerD family protein [Spirosoma foliorum]|uniref:TerD family protein n=1 Tax=Spirosoma foliorum TaxID=2710596 RepID=A0A7G5H2K0_9BACT|nr:TerD family protein [Spirosoma foliorum]QMW05342.1 TerD family protein [Spirosoma foliorum]
MEQGLMLVKDEKVDLTKGNPGLKNVNVGMGWDVSGGASSYDLDAFAFALTANFKLASNNDVLFFGNKSILGGKIKHSGDNLTGAGDGDDETINIKLSELPDNVEAIILGVNIYQAEQKRQRFGMVKNAFIRLYDADSKQELMRYDLSEDGGSATGFVLGKMYKHNGEWKFQSESFPSNGDINQIAAQYR